VLDKSGFDLNLLFIDFFRADFAFVAIKYGLWGKCKNGLLAEGLNLSTKALAYACSPKFATSGQYVLNGL
jgi:hypothetical protein